MALCTEVQTALDPINASIASHAGRLTALEALELDDLATSVAAMATGIYFENTVDPQALNNTVRNVTLGTGSEVSGIKVTEGSGGTIAGNTVEDSYAGISLPYAHGVHVYGNTLRRLAKRGVYILCGSTDILCENNLIDTAPEGFAFAAYDIWPSGVTLRNNTATDVSLPVKNGASVTGLIEEGNSWQ